MGDRVTRVLCIGQSSRAVGRDVDRVSNLLGGIQGPRTEFVSDEIEVGSSSSSTRLMKCAHTLTEQTEYCGVCSRNGEILQDIVIRTLLEETDSSAIQKLCVISDSYTQFSTWASSITLEYLQLESSGSKGDAWTGSSGSSGGTMTVLMKPPLGACSGLECFYSLLSSYYSLSAAQCTVYRGVETSTAQMATANTPNQSNGTYGIACDLWPILCSTNATTTTAIGGIYEHTAPNQGCSTLHSYLQQGDRSGYDTQYHLWPLDICTSQNKIIDTRSSLAALLKRLLKPKNNTGSATSKPSSIEYNPLRSLSANVHAMHVAYCELYPDWTPTGHVVSANCANFSLSEAHLRTASKLPGAAGGIGNGYLAFTDLAHSEHELYVALNWATPGVHWPYRNATESNTGTERRQGSSGVKANSDLHSESGMADSVGGRPDTGYSRASDASIRSGTSTAGSVGSGVSGRSKRSAAGPGRQGEGVWPVNAVNVGRSNRHGGGADHGVMDDDISVLTTGTAGRTRAGESRLYSHAGRGRQGSVATAGSTASRLSQRSIATGTSNSRNMYALSAALRKEDSNSAYGDNRTYAISSAVFDSPYGRQDCAHICASVRRLLSIGAYRHLFGPAGSAFTREELQDAVEVVQGYCCD